jgi:hypothetical protein
LPDESIRIFSEGAPLEAFVNNFISDAALDGAAIDKSDEESEPNCAAAVEDVKPPLCKYPILNLSVLSPIDICVVLNCAPLIVSSSKGLEVPIPTRPQS